MDGAPGIVRESGLTVTTLSDHVTLFSAPTREVFADALALKLAEWIRKDVAERGAASLIVSGGSTPRPVFERLRRMELPWDKLSVTLADERWVPATSDDSTEKLVREALLHPDMTFIGLVNKAATPEEGEAEAHRQLLTLPRLFTATLLGLGEDGHTASLFPHHASLKKALDKNYNRLCVAVEDAPKPPPSRMTLTLAALLDTDRIVFHIVGQDKLDKLHEAMIDGPIENLPVRAFLQQIKVPVEIYWAA